MTFGMLNRLAIFALAALVSAPALAGGYQTCSLSAHRVKTVRGVEQPTSAAYKKVCRAVLPPTCENWVRYNKPCAVRTCLVDDSLNTCPNGDPPAYVANQTPVLTKAQMAAMNAQTDAAAQRMSAGESVSPAEINARQSVRQSGWNSTGAEMIYK